MPVSSGFDGRISQEKEVVLNILFHLAALNFFKEQNKTIRESQVKQEKATFQMQIKYCALGPSPAFQSNTVLLLTTTANYKNWLHSYVISNHEEGSFGL